MCDPDVEDILEDGDHVVDTMFTDATFSVACRPFYQLLNVSFLYCGQNITVYHVVMEGKGKRLYEEIFRTIKERHPDLVLKESMTDFEAALVSAIHKFFPEARQRGCQYHYMDALLRKIKSEYHLLLPINSGARLCYYHRSCSDSACCCHKLRVKHVLLSLRT
ncbi:MAG: hypothetical protein Q8O19_05385 [Rectinemataceae bacterium]|nr:hypothetical protein [Rectinemataceae bacterium]